MIETAYIIQPKIRRPRGASQFLYPSSYQLHEAVNLATAIPLSVSFSAIRSINTVHPATFLGTGVVQEIQSILDGTCVSVVIVNTFLSAIQQRNLEKVWNCKVIDRPALILEIFSKRAQTHESIAQVELAALKYQKARLVRSWTHLERQRGGLGSIGGPGELQIEIDRRLIQTKIGKLERQLETVKKTRTLHRRARDHTPKISLVGYTNSGKSTLFNALTVSDVCAENVLFSTLDPTIRAHVLKNGRRVLVADTVGFIADLPHSLVASFSATLEEVRASDIILHVQDATSPYKTAHACEVMKVLTDLGVDPYAHHVIDVYNKSDLLCAVSREAMIAQLDRKKNTVLISARDEKGLESLEELIQAKIDQTSEVYMISFSTAYGDMLHWLYEEGVVASCSLLDDGNWALRVRLSDQQKNLLHKRWRKKINTFECREPDANP